MVNVIVFFYDDNKFVQDYLVIGQNQYSLKLYYEDTY